MTRENFKCPLCGEYGAYRAQYNHAHVVHRCHQQNGNNEVFYVGYLKKINGKLIFFPEKSSKEKLTRTWHYTEINQQTKFNQIINGLQLNNLLPQRNNTTNLFSESRWFFLHPENELNFFPYDVLRAYEWQKGILIGINKTQRINSISAFKNKSLEKDFFSEINKFLKEKEIIN